MNPTASHSDENPDANLWQVEIAQPHDRLFKVLLSEPESAYQFFRERLPEEIVMRLAPELPEWVEGSFVPDALSLFLSDRLFRLRMAQGAPAFIHLLTEHKSFPDRKVGWQVTRGIVACMEQALREQGTAWETLPAVISMVVYHGNTPWSHPNDLISLIDADRALHPWLLNVHYVLVDLSNTADRLLSSNARLKAGFLALKYGTRAPHEQMAALDQIADALRAAPELLVPVLLYLMTTFPLLQQERLHAIVMQVKPEEETNMMSIFARELIAKGREEGEILGRIEGERKNAVSMLLRQMQRKFGPLSVQAQKQVEEADLAILETWADRILDACTLDELLEPHPSMTTH
ncbi:MAG: Rpn family recombination-promoting nuclease/putative transposase [Magnetococcales bacterium]|nr:Rpn family recombination-promoting nuclease/putative transposase [Magnetococcales bacterium]